MERSAIVQQGLCCLQLGDILVLGDRGAQLLVAPQLADFLCEALTSVRPSLQSIKSKCACHNFNACCTAAGGSQRLAEDSQALQCTPQEAGAEAIDWWYLRRSIWCRLVLSVQ